MFDRFVLSSPRALHFQLRDAGYARSGSEKRKMEGSCKGFMQDLPSSVSRGSKGGKGKGTAFIWLVLWFACVVVAGSALQLTLLLLLFLFLLLLRLWGVCVRE